MGALELVFFWILNPWWDLIMLTFYAIAGSMWQNCAMCNKISGLWKDDSRGAGFGHGLGVEDDDDEKDPNAADQREGWPYNKGKCPKKKG